MLTLSLDPFDVQLKDGSIRNVGAPDKRATVKLFDVETPEVREFGDRRVKFAFSDEDGNEVEVALFPEQARAVADAVESLSEDSPVFE